MKFKKWLKFYGLSFFSDKIAKSSLKHGFACVFISVITSFILFFAGFYAADVVPFAVHFNNSTKFTQFIESAFSDGLSVRINEKSAECEKKINTYTDGADGEIYGKNGYNLIIDTRPTDMLVEFTQVAVKDGATIEYQAYLDLPEEEKAQYMLETNYSDKELIFTEERVAQYTSYLNEISTEGNEKYNKSASEEYENLKNNRNKYSEQKFAEEIYYLFVKYYHKNVQSYFVGAKAPLLVDYYYVNYLAAGKAEYLYIFRDLCTGSFKTDSGVPVVFGGYYDGQPDGGVSDICAFIQDIFYQSAGKAFVSYFTSTLAQLPFGQVR